MITKNYDELEITILKNLCVVVGIEYDSKLFQIPYWNKMNKWTIYERNCFKLWLTYFLKKHLNLTSQEAEKSSLFFIEKYGWELGLRSEIAHGLVRINYKGIYKQLFLRRY
jgi:hypothetical protein